MAKYVELVVAGETQKIEIRKPTEFKILLLFKNENSELLPCPGINYYWSDVELNGFKTIKATLNEISDIQ